MTGITFDSQAVALSNWQNLNPRHSTRQVGPWIFPVCVAELHELSARTSISILSQNRSPAAFAPQKCGQIVGDHELKTIGQQ
jgi:hypothetical protein